MISEFTSRYLKSHNDNEVLKILIEKGIADEKVIRNYMIVSDYNQMITDNYYLPEYLKKSAFQIFIELGEKYDLSERQIATIFYKWRKKFKQ